MEVHIVLRYSKYKNQESVYYTGLAVVVHHMEIACHTAAENRSSYMAEAYSQMTRIPLDCLALFQKEHNKPVLECHNSDSMLLLLGVVHHMHYTS